MRRVLCALMLVAGWTLAGLSPGSAANCVVELSGGYRCDDGTVLKPEAGGGLKSNRGTVMQPDGSGGFRGSDGQLLKPNGYGGLSQETAAVTSRGGTQFPGVPDSASGRRVGGGSNGYAAPLSNRDCRPDTFGGYRCR